MKEDIERQMDICKMQIIFEEWKDGEKPPASEALTSGAIVALLCLSVAFLFKHIPYMSVITLIVMLILLITIRLAPIFSPKTWGEQVDRILTDYQPADVEAFRQLQDDVKERGELTAEMFGKWLQLESQLVMPDRENTTQYTFASRIIQDDKDARP